MCGIITVLKKADDGVPTNTAISGMLTAQAHRGIQGFGYLSFNDIVTSYTRREMRYEIERALEKNNSRSIMFHHRFPTSTPNLADCTHPIKVSHDELEYDYYLIHNGMVSNDSILRKRHIELGYEYMTTVTSTITTQNNSRSQEKWNDSEALAIDVARYIEGKQEKIESCGSIAFVCARVEKESGKVTKIFFGRNSSPLTINITKNAITIRSEGEEEIVEANMLYTIDMTTFRVQKEKCKVGELISSRSNDNYRYPDSYYSMDDYDPMSDGRRESLYVPDQITKFLTRFKGDGKSEVEVTPVDDDMEAQIVEANMITDLIDETELKMATLRDEILDLTDERRNLDKYPGNEHDFEIEELDKQIGEKRARYKKYQDDLELLETGQLDEVLAR